MTGILEVRSEMRFNRALPLLLLAALLPATALAWGREGHKVACEIAWQRIAPETKEWILELRSGDRSSRTFSESCLWADHVREEGIYPETSSQHYVNIPPGASGYQFARDCGTPEKRCVVWAIEHWAAATLDGDRTRRERHEALKFLAHFVADVHQPLHAGRSKDRGGNEIDVSFFGDRGSRKRRLDLHDIWDYSILERGGVKWPESGQRLASAISEEDAHEWTDADPALWANESHRICDDFVYPSLPRSGKIRNAYWREAFEISTRRLQQTGVRLAHVLDELAAGRDPFGD